MGVGHEPDRGRGAGARGRGLEAARYAAAMDCDTHVIHCPKMSHLRDVPDEPPPFLRSWGRIYKAVFIYLVLIIGGFYLFTRAYR